MRWEIIAREKAGCGSVQHLIVVDKNIIRHRFKVCRISAILLKIRFMFCAARCDDFYNARGVPMLRL